MVLVCGYRVRTYRRKRWTKLFWNREREYTILVSKIALEETKINCKWDLCGSRLTLYLVMVHARPLYFSKPN
jgi:hypothetical protein